MAVIRLELAAATLTISLIAIVTVTRHCAVEGATYSVLPNKKQLYELCYQKRE